MLLFDEIEKAHPDVFNVLLQLLDDGRLTDGQGRIVDFKNVVVIMTSNVGSQFLADGIDEEIAADRALGALRESFRPEFINRIDEIVVFRRLSRRADRFDRRSAAGNGRRSGCRSRRRADGDTLRHVACSATRATTRPSAPGRWDGSSASASRTSSARGILGGAFGEGDTVRLDANDEGALTFTASRTNGRRPPSRCPSGRACEPGPGSRDGAVPWAAGDRSAVDGTASAPA